MSFKDNLYEVVRGAIQPQLLEHLDLEFELLKRVTYMKGGQSEENKFMFGDSQVTNSFAYYSASCFESLSVQLMPLMEKITDKELYNTYTYARIYYNGAVMKEHTDRPSCEFSTTINISVDPEPWEIWFDNLKGDRFPISLNPGDLIVYKGDILPHWRDEYTGERQTQAFLHYVDKFGKYRDYKWDHRPYLGFPPPSGGKGGI
jgi:hypothetical protein